MKLKSCPFCGSQDASIHEVKKLFTLDDYYSGNSTELKNPFFAFCDTCGVYTNAYPTAEEAAIVWNTRTNRSQHYSEILAKAFYEYKKNNPSAPKN